MSVTIPPALAGVVELLAGQSWPRGDEDGVRHVAQIWTTAMVDVLNLSGNANDSAMKVHANVYSTSADAFEKFWDSYISSHGGRLVNLIQQFEAIARTLITAANEIEYTKIEILATAATTAIQLIWAMSMAVFTDGVSLADIPAILTAGRFIVNTLIGRFLQMLAMMVIPDLVAQSWLYAQNRGWDWHKTWNATEYGLVTGFVAMTLGRTAERLPWMREGAAPGLDNKVVQLITHFVEGSIVNQVSQDVVNTINSTHSEASLLSDVWAGGLAAIFHGANLANGDGFQIDFTGTDGRSYHANVTPDVIKSLLSDGILPRNFSGRTFTEHGRFTRQATPDISGAKSIIARYGPGSVHFEWQSDPSGQGGKWVVVSRTQPVLARHGETITFKGGTYKEVPSGSTIHISGIIDYNNVIDSTNVYRVDIPLGRGRTAVWQTDTPGDPLRLTGVKIERLGRTHYFAIDNNALPTDLGDPRYGVAARSIMNAPASHPATSEISLSDATYNTAFEDLWKPGQAASQSSATAPAGQAPASAQIRPHTQSRFEYPAEAESNASQARNAALRLASDERSQAATEAQNAQDLAARSRAEAHRAAEHAATAARLRQDAARYDSLRQHALDRANRAHEAQTAATARNDANAARQAATAEAEARRAATTYHDLATAARTDASTADTSRAAAMRDAGNLDNQAATATQAAEQHTAAAATAEETAAQHDTQARTARRQIDADSAVRQHDSLAETAATDARQADSARKAALRLASDERSQAATEAQNAQDLAARSRAEAHRAAEHAATAARLRQDAARYDSLRQHALDRANRAHEAQTAATARNDANAARQAATAEAEARRAATTYHDLATAARTDASTADTSRAAAMRDAGNLDNQAATATQAAEQHTAAAATAEETAAQHDTQARTAWAARQRALARRDAASQVAADPAADPLLLATAMADRQAARARDLITQAQGLEARARERADELSQAQDLLREYTAREARATAASDPTEADRWRRKAELQRRAAARAATHLFRSEARATQKIADAVNAHYDAQMAAHYADDGSGGRPRLVSKTPLAPTAESASGTSPDKPGLRDSRTVADIKLNYYLARYRDPRGGGIVSNVDSSYPALPGWHLHETRGPMREMLRAIGRDSPPDVVASAITRAVDKIERLPSFGHLDPSLQHLSLARVRETARMHASENQRLSELGNAIASERFAYLKPWAQSKSPDAYKQGREPITSITTSEARQFRLTMRELPDGSRYLSLEHVRWLKGVADGVSALARTKFGGPLQLGGISLDAGVAIFDNEYYQGASGALHERMFAIRLKGSGPLLIHDRRAIDGFSGSESVIKPNPFGGLEYAPDILRPYPYLARLARYGISGLHLAGTVGATLAAVHGIGLATAAGFAYTILSGYSPTVSVFEDLTIFADPNTGRVREVSLPVGVNIWIPSLGIRDSILRLLPFIGRNVDSNWGAAASFKIDVLRPFKKDVNGVTVTPAIINRTAELGMKLDPAWNFGNWNTRRALNTLYGLPSDKGGPYWYELLPQRVRIQ